MLRIALVGLAGYAAYRILRENGLVREPTPILLPPPADRGERMADRRTPGRSEMPEVLEEQLQEGLESSFPASDPPAVVSTAISGRTKGLVGTDEALARMRESGERPH
jgi:hypothetical protein